MSRLVSFFQLVVIIFYDRILIKECNGNTCCCSMFCWFSLVLIRIFLKNFFTELKWHRWSSFEGQKYEEKQETEQNFPIFWCCCCLFSSRVTLSSIIYLRIWPPDGDTKSRLGRSGRRVLVEKLPAVRGLLHVYDPASH